MVMLVLVLWISITVLLQLPVCSAIKCVIYDPTSGDLNQTEKQCNSKKQTFDACSVLWEGTTKKDVVIKQRECWASSSIGQCGTHVGPCIPQKLPVGVYGFGYWCCCKGDLCNKIPQEIVDITTDPPISDPRVQVKSPTSWYIPSLVILSLVSVFATLAIAAYCVLRRRRRRCYVLNNIEVREKRAPKIDLTKQLCSSDQSFPHQLWLASYRAKHKNQNTKSLLSEEKLTVRVTDQASAVRWSRETRLLSSVALSHAHVISVVWWGKKHRKSWLVYKDVYVGTLTHILQQCTLSIDQVKKLSECIFSGLAYLHCTVHAGSRSKIAISHGDVRTDNILLKHNYVPVLGNFHSATRLQYCNFDKLSTSVETISKLMSTNHYLAPELFTRTKAHLYFDNSFRQIDVYCASLVVWQILNRCHDGGVLDYSLPYEHMVGEQPTLAEIATVVKQSRPTLHTYWLQHPEIKKVCWLLLLGWKANPSQRLTAHCIHRLFRDDAALAALCGGRGGTKDTTF